MVGLAVACGMAITLAPHWERELYAQSYLQDFFNTIGGEALQDADDERSVVGNHLDQSRREAVVRRWGIFLTFGRDTVRHGGSGSGSSRRPPFDAETPGFLLGLDRRLSDALLLGLATGFKVTHVSFPFDPMTQFAARQRTYTGTVGPYLSYTPDQAWHLHASLLAGLLGISTERSGKNLTSSLRGETSGRRLSAALGGGYEWRYRALRVGPSLELAYDRVLVDAFCESGGKDHVAFLQCLREKHELVTIKSGARGSYAQVFSWGALVPHWRLDFVYRNAPGSSGTTISSLSPPPPGNQFAGDDPDPTSMEVGFGLQFALPNALTFWLDYQENFLEQSFARSQLTIGVRKQF